MSKDKIKGISKAHTVYKLADGTRVPGATTITGLLNKPHLVRWANKLGLEGIDSSKYTDEAAAVGTLAHALVQAHLQGETLDTTMFSPTQVDLAENAVLSYLEWEKRHKIEPLICEVPMVSEKLRYGGTVDCYCRLDGVPTLIDFISKGIKIGYSPIDVRVRKPDEDFKKEDYPLISLYNVYSKRDDFRRCFEPVPVEKNVETKTIVMEQAALPYNLFYQIDFWSLQQSQMNSMLMQWVSLTQGGKDFNLPVIDTGGNSRSCYCLCKDDFKKSDLVDGNKRIFHSFITYRIYVEIDENIRISEPMITDVGITTKKEV